MRVFDITAHRNLTDSSNDVTHTVAASNPVDAQKAVRALLNLMPARHAAAWRIVRCIETTPYL